jgi:hypothetical protein
MRMVPVQLWKKCWIPRQILWSLSEPTAACQQMRRGSCSVRDTLFLTSIPGIVTFSLISIPDIATFLSQENYSHIFHFYLRYCNILPHLYPRYGHIFHHFYPRYGHPPFSSKPGEGHSAVHTSIPGTISTVPLSSLYSR